jgi:hypothetical protein
MARDANPSRNCTDGNLDGATDDNTVPITQPIPQQLRDGTTALPHARASRDLLAYGQSLPHIVVAVALEGDDQCTYDIAHAH